MQRRGATGQTAQVRAVFTDRYKPTALSENRVHDRANAILTRSVARSADSLRGVRTHVGAHRLRVAQRPRYRSLACGLRPIGKA